jgi:mannose-6-phosphate isomerase-like protein (cupin superfamily)
MMHITRSHTFVPHAAWEALDIARMGAVTTRLYWADQPYKWHINDGPEVFVVLSGTMEICSRSQGVEESVVLQSGDVMFADEGCEHMARPHGSTHILIIKQQPRIGQTY